MVSINITQEGWVIISGLVAGIIILCVYIKQLHNIHRREQKENLVNLINAMNGGTKALEGNTKVIDEVKNLVHTVNKELITLNAKNGK